MTTDYSRKASYDETIVLVIHDCKNNYYKNLVENIINIAGKYGVRVTDDASNLDQYRNCLIKHAIVMADTDNPVKATQKYQYLLDTFNSMSLGIIYDSEKSMMQWRDNIEALKEKYNSKINYLRPDITLPNGMRIISQQKIIDNAICDTIRVKYNPKKNEQFDTTLDPTYKNFFKKISDIYMNRELYHRSPSDGFFAVRYKHGFYITATKTHKGNLDFSRISFVHNYDRSTNELSYSGQYLPSSDVVEASLVFKHNPDIMAIIHTHASDQLTRNPEFKHKIGVSRESYGIPELGDKINKVINKFHDDFLILEEHGEVFAILGDIKDAPAKMEKILTETIGSKVFA